MVDRLWEQAVFVREDRGYNVDHLGEVGDLDGLAVAGEDVRPVVVASRVDVYAVVVDERREAFDHHPVPIRQAAEAAADELYVRARPPHYLGELTVGQFLCNSLLKWHR